MAYLNFLLVFHIKKILAYYSLITFPKFGEDTKSIFVIQKKIWGKICFQSISLKIGGAFGTANPILSLRSTHVTIIQSARETGDMHTLSNTV